MPTVTVQLISLSSPAHHVMIAAGFVWGQVGGQVRSC